MNTALKDLIVGGLLLSTAGLFIVPMEGELSLPQIVFVRAAVVVAFMFLRRCVQRGGKNPFKDLPISFSPWQVFGSVGGRALNSVCFIGGVLLAGSADAYLICNSAPVYLAFYQILCEKRRPSLVEVITILINAVGLALIFYRDTLLHQSGLSEAWLGTLICLVGGMSFAGLLYSHSRVGKEGATADGEPYTVGTIMLGNLATLPLAALLCLPTLITSENSATWKFWHTETMWVSEWPSVKTWLLAIGLGVVQSAMAETYWARAMREVPPLLSAFAPTSVAVLATIWSALFLNEAVFDIYSVCGMLLVHLAVVVIAIHQKRKKR